jgi:acyl-CoA thioester hydrolase
MTASDEVRFVFWHRERVRFRDVDLQRIVYYGKYLDYFDNALYEYLRSLGFESGVLNERYGFDTSVVHAEIDYVSPASFDDLLDIGVRVTRMGRTSFDASFGVRQSGRVICRASLVLVNYDEVAARARPLPANIREAIEASNAAGTR